MEAARHPWPALGVLLMRDGLVGRAELEAVVAEQGDSPGNRVSSRRLGEVLVDRGLVTSAQIARLVAEQHELPFVELEASEVPAQLARRLPEEVARRCSALPIRSFPDGSLVVAFADPTEIGCFDDVRRELAVPLRFAVATPEAVAAAIDVAYSPPSPAEPVHEDSEGDAIGDAAPTSVGEPPPPPVQTEEPQRPVFGSLLLGDGLVTEEDLEAALAQQRISPTKTLGEILVSRGVLTEQDVAAVLAQQHELPYLDLDDAVVDPAAASLLPVDVARRYSALPVSYLPNGSVLVAVADPTTALSSDELRVAVGGAVQFGVAAAGQIHDTLAALTETHERDTPPAPEPDEPDRAYSFQTGEHHPRPAPEPEDMEPDEPGTADVLEFEAAPDPGSVPEERLAVVPPVAPSLVAPTIRDALELGASSIHFTPRPGGLTVQARVDGVLRELTTIPGDEQEHQALAELAALGRVDGGTRRVVAMAAGERTAGIRPVRLPMAHGERFTVRVLEDASAGDSVVDLIDADETRQALGEALDRQSGILLICGTSGSGRTTTLYAAVRELRVRERMVMTIEEAVDGLIDGIVQTEVDPIAGVTFASGLHAILRSDPDVVAVDELLDPETVRMAARGARAGHLVLSTLEAPTASAGVRRLLDWVVEPSGLSTALTGVVAQRLLRSICLDCRDSYYPTTEELAELGRPSEEAGRRLLGRGRGCAACGGTGYGGRVAVFEMLAMSETVRALVAVRASADAIEQAAVADGMQTLREGAVQLCLEGMTTPAEIRRVFPLVRSRLRLS